MCSGIEQVLLWDDTDQSSKQMLVHPVLRGKADWKWGFETGSRQQCSFWLAALVPACLHRISLGKRQNPEKIYVAVFRINRD
jgi:hypothetical protein